MSHVICVPSEGIASGLCHASLKQVGSFHSILHGPGYPLSWPGVPQVHDVVEKTGIVKDGWNGYNVMHDTASRVAALDLGFLPSARSASAPPPKFVYLLGSDDFAEQDIPADAFVVYQVGTPLVRLVAKH